MIANDNKSWWKENETGNDIRKSTYNVSASRFGKSELLYRGLKKANIFWKKEGGLDLICFTIRRNGFTKIKLFHEFKNDYFLITTWLVYEPKKRD